MDYLGTAVSPDESCERVLEYTHDAYEPFLQGILNSLRFPVLLTWLLSLLLFTDGNK
jgi:hypothetical protein